MDNNQDLKDQLVPHIVANAKINITLGTAAINNIQMTYAWLLEGKGEEDANRLKGKLERKESLTGWELALITITNLLREIHEQAKESKQVEYHSLEDTLKKII